MHAYNLCIHRLVIIATLMFTIIFHYNIMSVTELLTLSACARVTVVVVCVFVSVRMGLGIRLVVCMVYVL